MDSPNALSPPQLEFVLELRVNLGPAIEMGASASGIRRTIPITGGTFAGPHLAGRILPGGSDWQFVESDGLTRLDAHYVIETDDSIRIEVRNQGTRYGSSEVLARIAAGESVSPQEYYFRTTPAFYPPVGQFDWLRHSTFVGSGERTAIQVIVKVWRVL